MTDELIIENFESIGIPKMQTIIYLDLLKNKESTATQVSKRTKMHRANVYDTLTKLKERNLVYISNKEGKQIFAALPTDLILNDETNKLEKLKSTINYINTTYISDQTPRVYNLEGLSPIKNILFKLLEKKSDIWIYGLAEDENIIKVLNDRLLHSFHMERIRKHIELKLLFYKLPNEEIKALSGLKFTQAKLLPKTQQSKASRITQIVCGDQVYITLWIDPIHTIVIENDGELVVAYTSSGDRASSHRSPWVYALVGRAALSLGEDEFALEIIKKLQDFQVQDENSKLNGAFIEGASNDQHITQFTMQESILTLQQGSPLANP